MLGRETNLVKNHLTAKTAISSIAKPMQFHLKLEYTIYTLEQLKEFEQQACELESMLPAPTALTLPNPVLATAKQGLNPSGPAPTGTPASEPDNLLPQIALAGRSNVGKSTLINALANRKDLAKVSATPGKTRSLNFYRVLPSNYYLVDLPGYGYARCSKTERAKWGKLISAYIKYSPTLQGVALLLDCRLPPQESDCELAAFVLGQNLPLLPILTKIDKCKQAERHLRMKEWEPVLGHLPILQVSGKTGSGLGKLWEQLAQLALT